VSITDKWDSARRQRRFSFIRRETQCTTRRSAKRSVYTNFTFAFYPKQRRRNIIIHPNPCNSASAGMTGTRRPYHVAPLCRPVMVVLGFRKGLPRCRSEFRCLASWNVATKNTVGVPSFPQFFTRFVLGYGRLWLVFCRTFAETINHVTN